MKIIKTNKLIFIGLLWSMAGNATSASVDIETHNGGRRIIAFREITQLLQEPMDNCKQDRVNLVVSGKFTQQNVNGYFYAKIDGERRKVYVDLRGFDAYHVAEFRRFLKIKMQYHAVIQICGSAGIIDLVEIGIN